MDIGADQIDGRVVDLGVYYPQDMWEFKLSAPLPPGGGPVRFYGSVPLNQVDTAATTVGTVAFLPEGSPPEGRGDWNVPISDYLLNFDFRWEDEDGNPQGGGFGWADGWIMWMHLTFLSGTHVLEVPKGAIPTGAFAGYDHLTDPTVHALVFTTALAADWEYVVDVPVECTKVVGRARVPGPGLFIADLFSAPGNMPKVEIEQPIDATYPYKDPTAAAQAGDSGVVRRGRP